MHQSPPSAMPSIVRLPYIWGGLGAISGLLFFYLCAEVRERATLATDLSIRRAIDAHTPSVPHRAISAASLLGSAAVIIITGLLLCLTFCLRRRWPDAVFIAGMVGGYVALTMMAQGLMQRERPLASFYRLNSTDRFPSGHTVGITCLAMALGYFLWRGRCTPWMKGLISVALVGSILLVGGSRLVLRKHYPTDILGGILLGIAWMAVLIAARLGLERERKIGGRRGSEITREGTLT